MSEFIVIRIHQDLSAEWVAVKNGTLLSSPVTGNLIDASKEAVNRTVIVLVPSKDVLLSNIKVPARSVTKIQNALPFALEEYLAEDIENLHFAIGKRLNDSSVDVAVVSNEKMSYWTAALDDAGINPTIISSENQGLLKIPGTMSMLIENETIMFNDGDKIEFATQNIGPTNVIELSGKLDKRDDNSEEASKHLFVFCSSEKSKSYSNEWLALQNELSSVDVNILPDAAISKLAVTIASGHGINLLQGSYGKKTEYNELFKPWKTAISLFFALLIIIFASKTSSLFDMIKYEQKLKSQFISEYQQIRPYDLREILDPIATVRSLKSSMNTSDAPQMFLPSLYKLSTAVAEHSDVKIKAISYRSGVINLRLTAPDVTTLDKIQKNITSSGKFKASIQSTDQVEDMINSRMQIKSSEL